MRQDKVKTSCYMVVHQVIDARLTGSSFQKLTIQETQLFSRNLCSILSISFPFFLVRHRQKCTSCKIADNFLI